MTSAQIEFLRDFAIDNLPRAQADREQANSYGGDLYNKLAFTAVMVRSKSGATATEFAAANILESVCLLQQPIVGKQLADTLRHLTCAANDLCLHTGKVIVWLAAAALEPEPEPEPDQEPPTPAKLLTSITGKWLSTKEAAQALGFAEQTLRQWAANETGPLRPNKVARRLKWSGDEILAVLKYRK